MVDLKTILPGLAIVVAIFAVVVVFAIERETGRRECQQSFDQIMNAQQNMLNYSLQICNDVNGTLVIKKVENKNEINDILVECKK